MKTYYILDPDTNTWSQNHLPLNKIMATPGITGNHLLANARTSRTLTVAQALAASRQPALKTPTVPLVKLPVSPTGTSSTTVPASKPASRLRPAGHPGKRKRSEYKVLNSQDECFNGQVNASSLELALNTYAQQGWKVLSCITSATLTTPAPGDFLLVMERKIAAAPFGI